MHTLADLNFGEAVAFCLAQLGGKPEKRPLGTRFSDPRFLTLFIEWLRILFLHRRDTASQPVGSYEENTVEPLVSDHPNCQVEMVAYESLDHNGSKFFLIKI